MTSPVPADAPRIRPRASRRRAPAAVAVLAAAGALLLAAPAVAAVVAGRVLDATTGEPLVNANVYVRDADSRTISLAGGYFSLRDAPDAPFTLVATFVGYEPGLVQVDPAAVAGEEVVVRLSPTVYEQDEIVVTASRYGSDVHLTHTNLPRDEIRRRQSDADIPEMLSGTPGVYAYDDAGNGVGYSYLMIRGFDQKRVGVLINGIPANDPEDQSVYWVDTPDLASSLEDIQVQRGVTNSLGGWSSIGGTVNLVTDVLPVEPEGTMSLFAGSYGTAKQTLSYKSGLLGGRFATALRISHLASDGYRQRAGSDQWGVFWSGKYVTPRSTTRMNVYTGRELTHHAWWAVDEATLARDRTWNPETYHNAVDDFRQPHVELHHELTLSPRVRLANSLYLVHGEGFYENYKPGENAAAFALDRRLGLSPDDTVDLIRQKWVRKDQIGWVPRLEIEHARGRLLLGGDVYTFHSNHWGEVVWAEGFTAADLADGVKYADYTGDKRAWSVYVNDRYEALSGLTLMGDLQWQHRGYDFAQDATGNFRGALRNAYTVDYDFFNPKAGVFWQLPGEVAGGRLGLYGHVGVAHREPTDSELFDMWQDAYDLGVTPLFAHADTVRAGGAIDHLEWSGPLVREERVLNYEVGVSLRSGRLNLMADGYWMDFTNEIVPSGQVDRDGFPIRGNAEKTLHRGIELAAVAQVADGQILRLSASRSWDEYRTFIYDWDGSAVDYSGNPIALFPQYILAASWRADWGAVDTGLDLRALGKQYLDNSGLDARTLDPYATVDLSIDLDLGRAGLDGIDGAVLQVKLRNVLDAEYETWGYYDPWGAGNYKLPAAGRNVLAGVRYDF